MRVPWSCVETFIQWNEYLELGFDVEEVTDDEVLSIDIDICSLAVLLTGAQEGEADRSFAQSACSSMRWQRHVLRLCHRWLQETEKIYEESWGEKAWIFHCNSFSRTV